MDNLICAIVAYNAFIFVITIVSRIGYALSESLFAMTVWVISHIVVCIIACAIMLTYLFSVAPF